MDVCVYVCVVAVIDSLNSGALVCVTQWPLQLETAHTARVCVCVLMTMIICRSALCHIVACVVVWR